ncbi:hypothetical protein [Methanobrevibacter sp.]|uniref:hypothetical protein n=1 Tax=Methanobrevibacter sp. TaxID=66852 RepID=UPI00386E0F5F
MSNQKRTRKFEFGNERFGGSYTPGDFEFNFPNDMSREEFERMFSRRMNALHKRGNDFAEEFFEGASKARKENLKPLSIRVKPHTKDFFKNNSILSPREVLEMYENFNNGSEAFINSLIEDEKQLEKELAEVQEKLHNAKLFKEKLGEMEPEIDVMTDEDKLAKLHAIYEKTNVKSIGNETSPERAMNEIIRMIQIYNTQDVSVWGNDYLLLTVYTNAQPVLFYFKNEYNSEDIGDIINHVNKYCGDNNIGFRLFENSNL